jgi:phosphoribosyl 1,2-cyclic phosphate phosphodiesterase
LKNKITILGCGSSLGSPWITGHKGNDSNNIKNIRTRCSAHIRYKNLSILIDTSPDIKMQFRMNKITDLDAVVYTHDHADQTAGIFELRPFFWKNKKKIPVYGSKETIKLLMKNNTYCFRNIKGYQAILESKIIKNTFSIKKKNNSLSFKTFEAQHGQINSTVYVFKKIAYMSDCNFIEKKNYKDLKNLDLLIIDCLRKKKHPSHFNYEEALRMSSLLKAKKTIFTNLHTDLDYGELKKELPKNILPAYDGLTINF